MDKHPQPDQTPDVARSLRHATGRSRYSWNRGITTLKPRTSFAEFAHIAAQPKVSREAMTPSSEPLRRRGFAPKGLEAMAPVIVKARQAYGTSGSTGCAPVCGTREAFRAQMEQDLASATVREVTLPREQALAEYHQMSPQQRADWVYGKTVAEYVPPMVKPTARWYRQLRPGMDYRQSNMAPVF